jgi:hypothetical protein
MTCEPEAHGRAALSICEALLLSLIDNKIIDETEAKALLSDAAAAHREAVRLEEGSAQQHRDAAVTIEAIRDGRNSVRRERPDAPALDDGGAHGFELP